MVNIGKINNQHNHQMNRNAEPEFGEDVRKAISKLRGEVGGQISISVKNYAYHLYFTEGYEMRDIVN